VFLISFQVKQRLTVWGNKIMKTLPFMAGVHIGLWSAIFAVY